MRTETIIKLRKRILCIALVIAVAFSAMLMTACKKKEQPENTKDTENSVRAADPMTEEELKADDTDGCIEDSEDLLY